jgi:hypothetical protein
MREVGRREKHFSPSKTKYRQERQEESAGESFLAILA